MEIRQFRVEMNGATPLIMNNPMTIGVDKGRNPLEWEREHLRDSMYFNSEGAPIIPASAIRKSAIIACKFLTDKPKARSFKSYGPLVEAALLVESDAVLNVTVDKMIADVRIVGLDPSKGPRGPRGPRCRPMIPLPWRAETVLVVVDDAITDDSLERILEASGRLVGVLDGRSIGMGRFTPTLTRI